MKFYKNNETNQVVYSNSESECKQWEATGYTELIPNTVDASREKHVPVVEESGDKVIVKVGSREHPMIDAHYIEWILLVTKDGYLVKNLYPNEKPEACFETEEKPEEIYSYCNLHGLWKSSL